MHRWLRDLARLGACFALLLAAGPARADDPPVPSGAHPRLFMSADNVSSYAASAGMTGSAAASLVARCQETIMSPQSYMARGGADGDAWPGAALSCAFAYRVLHDQKYLTQALLYWKTALNDDQTLGDQLGCTAAASSFDWRSKWDGNYPPPPILVTITHDTGYPMRWYGPYLALTYDWLYDAPGVDDALRAQTRACLTAWVDNYSLRGYLHDQAGANYNAGFVVAKALAAVAIGKDGGADGHLWTEVLHNELGKLLIGDGLAGAAGAIGTPAGVMVGGDWGSWQYGPLSVAEYAAATRALQENGAALPEMVDWVQSLIVRTIHGTVPKRDAQFAGNGDFDSEDPYKALTVNQLDAVLIGPSSDLASSWAQFEKQQLGAKSNYFWNALGDLRKVQPADYRAQSTPPPLWYLARGLGDMYVRTSWSDSAYWAVFMSGEPSGDHAHFAASNFVFSRGGDHLVVDSSGYGQYATLGTNAITADSAVDPGDYSLTQTPFGHPTMPWARGTAGGVFAARADIAHAFDFNGTPSDVGYAHREWVLLPEGEVVTLDRVHTSADARAVYLNFHTNTKGTLHLDSGMGVASGTVGGSLVAIHRVLLSGGTPKVVQPRVGDCPGPCNFPCGTCATARFAVDEYSVKIPGSWAVALHVIDGLASGEALAQVGSLNDDTYDPPPKQNGGVLGAAVYRSSKQSYVVASSAVDGAQGASMTYGVPGNSPGRHIVYDAPEAADGSSAVTASAAAGRCVVAIAAGAGSGIAGHPLMFQIGSADGGCTVSADTDVAPGAAPPGPDAGMPVPGGGGGPPAGASGSSLQGSAGCACGHGQRGWRGAAFFGLLLVGLASRGARRPRRSPR
jgi:hypothetical protein